MSPRPKTKEQHPNLEEAIKETAWRQIAEKGAPALSLRAIARALNITAPAIYNYFPRRDDLVTALIIDAYTSFGDWQIEARDAVPAGNLSERLKATGLAYRNWAMAYPQRYQLIFGSPIPGYEAPHEEVMPSAARSLSAISSVIEGLRAEGRLNAPDFPEVSQEYKISFEAWKNYGGNVDLLSLSVAVLIWARVHGIVSLEIAGNLPPFGPGGNALYMYEMEALKQQFIKETKSERRK
jgi:AcrR family transcriptional regulator